MRNQAFSSLVLVAALCGCGEVAKESANVASTGICNPINYRNGVMYFPCTGAEFGNSLSFWRLVNPEVEITAVTSDNTGLYGHTVGYFVVVKTTE